MIIPIDPDEPEGWTWLFGGTSHFFAGGLSLCGRYRLMAAPGDLDQRRPAQNCCTECLKEEKRRGKRSK